MLFAGDASEARLVELADPLAKLLARYTPRKADTDAVIDIRTVLSRNRLGVDYEAIPDLFRTRKGMHGYRGAHPRPAGV